MTTIRRHEQEYLLNVEIIHKYLRNDTALNVIDRIRRTYHQYSQTNEQFKVLLINLRPVKSNAQTLRCFYRLRSKPNYWGKSS